MIIYIFLINHNIAGLRKVLCKRCDLSLPVKDVANILKVEMVGVWGSVEIMGEV